MTALSSVRETLGFVGAGNMAAALIRSLVRAGFPAARLWVVDLDVDKTRTLQAELGIQIADDARGLAQAVDVVVLAVKPAAVAPVLAELRAGGDTSGKLWISVAAGITTRALIEALGGAHRVIRAMPNTPALVGAGATGLCAGGSASEEDLALAEQLLGAGGITARVDEHMMNAVTGLSGSGPAFVFLVIEALADGGVRSGLPRPTALRLAAQTVLGAASLVLETGKHPGVLKDEVTSPGGTTIAGIEALEKGGLRAAVLSAVVAAAQRSEELSRK